ncbi:tumor necrosis factor receptor superfamily member 16 isoform X1 [Nematostella vectensis]|uniref:tumor necrosis factor receptor superfamily member 16 isoform X1 n=1 Tax=Nematostella vectensis TaxID=45351 RepID=UPI00207776AF|nr:tumor necrosis factor receptor superfamily member 16 isoform X1 [Nematostella vectensis]
MKIFAKRKIIQLALNAVSASHFSLTMGVQLSFFLLLIHALATSGEPIFSTPENFNCKYDKYEICGNLTDDASCHCEPCPTCPIGKGVYPLCGQSRLLWPYHTLCKPCEAGRTYSDGEGIGSCNPCGHCDGFVTTKNCTTHSNIVCSTTCKKGFQLHPNLNSVCIPIPTPTAKPTSKPMPQLPLTSPPSTTTPSMPANHTTENRTNSADLVPSGQPSSPPLSRLEVILIVVLIVPAIALIVVIYRMCNRQPHANPDDTENFLINSSRESSSVDVHYAKDSQKVSLPLPPTSSTIYHARNLDMRLADIPFPLKQYISVEISKIKPAVSNWRHIADMYGKLPHEYYIQLDVPSGHLPGENLLDALNSYDPQLKLEQFVIILEKVQRNDMVEHICKEMAPKETTL